MVERIDNRRTFWFGYWGYGLMSFSSKCCCCCKRRMIRSWPYYKKQWFSYQKFKVARESLHREKDMEHMIYNMRISKFLQKTLLRKRQRDVVQYFMRYVIENDEIKKKEIARRASTAQQLIEEFNPEQDDFDRRILFELTNRRINQVDYHDDTSFESDGEHEESDNILDTNAANDNESRN